jgi:hypothetical protein
MSHSSDLQPVTVDPQYGRDDGDPLPGFRQREQCVRRAALEQILGSTSATRQAALNSLRTE